MRLFNQLLRELFVSHTILYFSCRRQKTNFQNINSVMNSNGTCLIMSYTEQNKSFTQIEHHAVTIDREGFTISHFSVSYEARHAFQLLPLTLLIRFLRSL